MLTGMPMLLLCAILIPVLASGLLGGCRQGADPLDLRVEAVREMRIGTSGTPGLLALSVTLENRGTHPVHVFFNGIRLVPEGGDPTGYGEFIRDFGPLVATDDPPDGQAALREALDALGFDRAWVLATTRNERAIEPGQTIRELIGFKVEGPVGWGTLELRYHDDATDRFERAQRPVRVAADSG